MNSEHVLNYVKRTYDARGGGFKFFEKGNTTILSTSFAVQLNFLFDNLDGFPASEIKGFLEAQQDKQEGFFQDKNFKLEDVVDFDKEYILWQFTFFATIALNMLQAIPRHSFSFLNYYKDENNISKWWKNQISKDFWYSSNKVMFLLYFLIFEQKKLKIDNTVYINHLFRLLDDFQDKDTGFWGTNFGTNLERGMYGAAHIYMFYDFCQREIKYKEKIINNTLKLQNHYSLFGSRFGGACEDYDAIEILSILTKSSPYCSEPVRNCLKKIYNVISKSQRLDGGFAYYIDTRSLFERLKDWRNNKEYIYRYSGWKKMKSNGMCSDLWGTYFRCLLIAKIEKLLNLNSKIYNFYDLPGWGYF